MEKDFRGPRFPLLARSCHMILVAYRHPCWVRGQLKNLCSTNSTNYGPQWGQHFSISVEIYQRHPSTASTLWMTDQRKATSFCALALCQMMFHVGEVEGGILFRHLCRINFLRDFCLVIHFLLSFTEYGQNGSNLWPPTTRRIKEHIGLGFIVASCEVVHPETCHPTWEGHWWCRILGIWFHLF